MPHPELARIEALATRHGVPVEGGHVTWHEWGAGRPLVLFHGGSGSWTHWVRNVEALAAAGRRVLVPDLPGFGDSSTLAGVSDADSAVAPLAASLRALAGDGPHDVTGFSFGGLTGGLMAAAQPGLIGRLVLVGAPGLGLRDKRLPLRVWHEGANEAERDAVHSHNLGVLMLRHPESIDDLAIALHGANLARDRLRRRRLAMTDVLARTLPTLACERHAIYGERDALYDGLMAQLQTLLAHSPGFGEIVLIPDAGHWVQYEAPEAFDRELLRLLPD